jgi:hypothetical protein
MYAMKGFFGLSNIKSFICMYCHLPMLVPLSRGLETSSQVKSTYEQETKETDKKAKGFIGVPPAPTASNSS